MTYFSLTCVDTMGNNELDCMEKKTGVRKIWEKLSTVKRYLVFQSNYFVLLSSFLMMMVIYQLNSTIKFNDLLILTPRNPLPCSLVGHRFVRDLLSSSALSFANRCFGCVSRHNGSAGPAWTRWLRGLKRRHGLKFQSIALFTIKTFRSGSREE